MVKGFVLNDSRFIKANANDKEYFIELYERIKLIRVSERISLINSKYLTTHQMDYAIRDIMNFTSIQYRNIIRI